MVITDTTRLLVAGDLNACRECCCSWMYGKRAHTHCIECAGHLDRGLNPELRELTLTNIVRILRCHEFDAIAFSGLSGALFAPMVAMAMDKTLLAVRKGEPCHSSRQVEGDYNARRYVILDDFIAMGSTVQHIIEEIRDSVPGAVCIGILEYCYINRLSDPAFALGDPDKYEGRSSRPPNPWPEIGKTDAPDYTPPASPNWMAFPKAAPLIDSAVQVQSLSLDTPTGCGKTQMGLKMYRVIDGESTMVEYKPVAKFDFAAQYVVDIESREQ
jgi:hypothetical protein